MGYLTGENSPLWKGDSAGQTAKHLWVKKHRGKAKFCSIDKTHKSKRFEWANISGQYKRDLDDYIQLCLSCHRNLDRITTCKRGHLFSDDNVYREPKNPSIRHCRECKRLRRTPYIKVINIKT